MQTSPLESFRHILIAAVLDPDPSLRRLALRRYDRAWRAIAELGLQEQQRLDAMLHAMLPSDWPLWVERYRRVTLRPDPVRCAV